MKTPSIKIYYTRRTFKVGDIFLWMGRRWRVLVEIPARSWFDEVTGYAIQAVA